MATGSISIRLTRIATWVAGGIAGVLVVLLGALAAGALVFAVVARRGLVLLDDAIGFSHGTRLTDELPGVAAPDVPE